MDSSEMYDSKMTRVLYFCFIILISERLSVLTVFVVLNDHTSE